MAGLRHDAGLDAGTTMASRRLERDLIGGAGVSETSWDSAAWEVRCSTFLTDRRDARLAALTDHHPDAVPTRVAAHWDREGPGIASGSPPPEL